MASRFLRRVRVSFRRVSRRIRAYLAGANRSHLLTLVIIALIWIVLFFLLVVFKGSYIFEGQIVAREMSFTYDGNAEKPFLQNVTGISSLDLRGKRSQSLTLKGSFSSDDAAINRKLESLNQIEIKFPFASSRLILAPTGASSAPGFAISSLRTKPQTRVNQLTYNQQQQLSFCLQSATQAAAYCLFPDDADNDPNLSPANTLGSLNLRLGKQTYIVKLEQVNIPRLNITINKNSYQAFTLNYTANNQEPPLNLLSPTKISLNLADKPEIKPDQAAGDNQLFYEDLDVKDVNFYRFRQTANVREEIQNSTIVSGKLRMHDRDLNLEQNQFLIVADNKPGIRKLRYLSLNSKQPASLSTLISGKSKGIAAGLYPQFAISEIKPSFLSQYLSSEAIAALLGSLSTFTLLALEKIIFKDPP